MNDRDGFILVNFTKVDRILNRLPKNTIKITKLILAR